MYRSLIPSVAILLSALAVNPAQGQLVAEEFESYTDGDVIGASASSTPWCRFGNATVDNVTATSHPDKVLKGFGGAQYVVRWPASFGSARFTPTQPVDLSGNPQMSLLIRSGKTAVGTEVRLAFDIGDTSFLSKQTWPLTEQTQTLSETLSADRCERVDGSASFAEAIKKVGRLGFNVVNRKVVEGEQTEVILFDGLEVSTAAAPVAEPQ